MTFFHSAARWKSRGFPRSTGIASSDAALYSQPARITSYFPAREKEAAGVPGGLLDYPSLFHPLLPGDPLL